MINPYATPKARSKTSHSRRARWRILKHICIFLVIFLYLNFDRFFGSSEGAAGDPEVRMGVSVFTLLLLYGAGYLMFARVRSRK
jgi:hypothetical protein